MISSKDRGNFLANHCHQQSSVNHSPPASLRATDSLDAQVLKRGPHARRTIVGGHGVVILSGSAPVNVEGQETTKIRVGGASYQVVAGVDTVIDGVPVEEYTPIDEGDTSSEPPRPISAGKAAAIAFAEAAERIQERELNTS